MTVNTRQDWADYLANAVDGIDTMLAGLANAAGTVAPQQIAGGWHGSSGVWNDLF